MNIITSNSGLVQLQTSACCNLIIDRRFEMKKSNYIMAIISFLLFMTMAHFVYHEISIPGDTYLLSMASRLDVLSLFSVVGTKAVIGLFTVLLILFLWWVKKDFAGILTVVVAVAGSNVMNKVIKSLMARERPSLAHGEEGYSFPSGHAMVGLVFLLILAYFISKEFSSFKVKIIFYTLAIGLAFLTGVSRIVEQAHYPSDVLGGFLLGYSFFVLSISLYEHRPKEEK